MTLPPTATSDLYARRWAQFMAGLAIMCLGGALCIRGRLGVIPWDVLHQGLVRSVGLTIGAWAVIVGLVIMLTWIPLRVRLRLGTLVNVAAVGIFMDAFLSLLPGPETIAFRIVFLLAGVFFAGLGTAIYIGARLGTGPRDGLMTGLVRRTGLSVAVIRTVIEVAAVLAGWALGGNLGAGTVLFAVCIGPIVHFFLPRVTVAGGHAIHDA